MHDGKVYWYESLFMVLSYMMYVFYFTQNKRICDHFGFLPPNGDGKDAEGPSCTAVQAWEDPVADKVPINVRPPIVMGGTGETDEVESIEAIGVAEHCGPDPQLPGGIGREFPSESNSRQSSNAPPPFYLSEDAEASQRKLRHSCHSNVSNSHVTKPGPAISQNEFSLRGKRSKTVELGSTLRESERLDRLKELQQVVPGAPAQMSSGTSSSCESDVDGTTRSASSTLPPQTEDCDKQEEQLEEEEEEDEERWCKYEPVLFFLDKVMPNTMERLWTLFGLCCIWISIFTYFAVDASSRVGCLLQIPDVVMGLVFLAAGTSVPDAMGSIAVARDGMGDMAVANAVGSNTFDILLGLGLPWFLKSAFTQEPIEVPIDQLMEAFIILGGCLVFYLVLIVSNNWVLTRNLGFLLLFLYCCAIALFLVQSAVHF
jgi:Ca2+/Na+ antiporter